MPIWGPDPTPIDPKHTIPKSNGGQERFVRFSFP